MEGSGGGAEPESGARFLQSPCQQVPRLKNCLSNLRRLRHPFPMALIINGETIDDEIIESEFRQIKGQYERTLQVACCERDPEFQGYAKDNIIARAVLNQEAAQRFPEVAEEEVTDRLGKLIEEAGGEEHFYMKIGMPMDAAPVVRGNVANGVRLDKLLQSVYGEGTTPTAAEVDGHARQAPHVLGGQQVGHHLVQRLVENVAKSAVLRGMGRKVEHGLREVGVGQQRCGEQQGTAERRDGFGGHGWRWLAP